MRVPLSTGHTRVLLSFSSAYADLARRMAADLQAANITVRYDQWEGGGGLLSTRSTAVGVDDVRFVLPILTPSDAAPTWISDEWRRAIYDKAVARGVDVLPVLGEGNVDAIPDFLRHRSPAVLHRDYGPELRRLITTIRERRGDSTITVPDLFPDAQADTWPPSTHPITVEVGATLTRALQDEGSAKFVNEMVPMMLDGLFYELGVRFPEPVLQSNPDVPSSSVRVAFYGVPEGEWGVIPDSVLVSERLAVLMDSGFAAESATNPATGASCAWIPERQRAAARNLGLMTWDTQEFATLALSSVLRRKAAHFIGASETRAMLEHIEPVFPLLVAECVPKTVPLFVLTDVLRRLVAELVCIGNLRRILMALVEWGRVEDDPLMLAEYVRAALQRQLSHQLTRSTNEFAVLLLHPDIEACIRDATRRTATASYVDLEPGVLRRIVAAIREPIDRLPNDVAVPQILTTMEIRSSVRRLVASSMPMLHVVSYQELRPDAIVQPLGRISLDGFQARPGVTVGGGEIWADAARSSDED